MTISQLFTRAEPYMKAIDKAVYHQPHPQKALLIKQKWQEFAVPKLVEIYRSSAQTVQQIIDSPSVRDAEIAYVASLGSGAGASDWAADLTGEIAAGVQVEHLDKDSVIALASYLTDVRLIAQLASAKSREDLGCLEHQIDVDADTDIVESLGVLFSYEADALGRPGETTLAAIEHLTAASETTFGEAAGLILLRWAHATGFLRDHAAEIQVHVDQHHVEREAYSATIDGDFGRA